MNKDQNILRRKSLKFIALISFFILLAVNPLYALNLTEANDLLSEIDAMGNFFGQDFSAIYTIVAESPGEERSINTVRLFRRDETDQFLILILEPEVERGQGYLQIDDTVWFYDPDSRRFERSTLREDIQGSDAQNNDLRELSLADDYEVVAAQEGSLNSLDVYILDLKAKRNDVSYASMRIWVRKDNNVVLKEEDYSVNGRLMRTAVYPRYASVQGRLIPSEILIIDEINEGERTQLTMTQPRIGAIPSEVFTRAYLERVNR
jgi:outer membrane lipoprotein-sorting protein